MTWPRATFILVIAGLFDAIRFFFEGFWFFGPAAAGLACTAVASDYVGGFISTAACGAGAAVVGIGGVEILGPFGVIMAMAVGLTGFLFLGLWILLINPRILKANENGVLRFAVGLLVSEVPLVGALPALSVTTWRLYHNQIKKEKADYKKWQKENAAQIERERAEQAEQAALLMQMNASQEASEAIY